MMFLQPWTGWWLNQPLWKIWVKLGIFPQKRGEKKNIWKPPPSGLKTQTKHHGLPCWGVSIPISTEDDTPPVPVPSVVSWNLVSPTLWRPSRWKSSCDQSCGFNKPQPGKVWTLVFLHEASVVDFGISLQMVTVTLPLFKDGHHARRFVKHGILSVSSRNSFPSPAHIGVFFFQRSKKNHGLN